MSAERCYWCDQESRGAAMWQGNGERYGSCGQEGHGAFFDEQRIAEWDYGYRLIGDDGNVYKTGFAYDDPADAFDRAKMRAAEENAVREEKAAPRLAPQLIRRRKAGPWEVIPDA